MDAFDFLGESVVSTPVGLVAVSVASHDDGSMSAVAWLLATGRRVAYLCRRPRQRRSQDMVIDAQLDGTAVPPLMESMLDRAGGLDATRPVVGQDLVYAGVLTQEQLSDMLSWQWLMAEVGQSCELGELAVRAGLLDPREDVLLGDMVERSDPMPRRLPPTNLSVGSEAVGASL